MFKKPVAALLVSLLHIRKIVSFSVVVLLITVLFAGVVTVPAGAQIATTTTITTNNTNPALNQSFTLSGTTPLVGQPIILSIQAPSGQTVKISATTDTNGSYQLTTNESTLAPTTTHHLSGERQLR